MTTGGDPYRTLGLAPGASVNEIRSAYRRLAKRYHPDAAGDRTLARFLAIQAAYEVLVDANGNLRRKGPTGSAGPRQAPEPWRADAARARASRDAWRARARPGAPGSGDPPPGRTDPSAGAGSGSQGQERREGPAEHRHRRHRRTATPGSTTYDEAGETPLDPAWEGGTWYGASSGTYWTLNPREYADPRKHGPEYRRRAWRAAGFRAPARPPGTHPADAADTQAADGPGPDTTSGSGASTPHGPGAPTGGAAVASAGHDGFLGAFLPERLLARAERDPWGRMWLAALAAAPVPLVAGAIFGGLAGCSAGGCPPLVPALALLAWPVAALVLAAIPVMTALGAFAVLVAGSASLLSGVVAATANGDIPGSLARAGGTLGVVLYCFALVIGAARLYGRRETSAPDA